MKTRTNSRAWGTVHEMQNLLAVLAYAEDCRHRIEREAIQDGSFDVIFDEAVQLEAHLARARSLWKRAQNQVITLLEEINAAHPDILADERHVDAVDPGGLSQPAQPGRNGRVGQVDR